MRTLATLTLLLLPAAAAATERPWALQARGGAAVPIPSNRVTTRGALTLGLERTVWGPLGLELSGRVGVAEIATDLALSGGVKLDMWRGRHLRVEAALRAGYAAIRVEKYHRSLWTGALLLSPGVELHHELTSRLELCLAPLTFTFYWNELWIPSWEPGVGLALRF